MNDILPKVEYEAACNMLSNILEQSVDEIELTDTIPPINDIVDSNKVFKGKLSILFVDMRKSTDLTDELESKKTVKVYRSFIRMIVQAIRYCGGQSRQFAGDGVMGVFQDDLDADIPETSCKRAVRAGRYILTLIDYCLNPQLKKYLDNITLGCGIGICTGTVMATKIGMRGKEADDTAENETGIAWVGSTTNYASRFCSLALPREIFIDDSTYNGIAVDTEHWKKETRVKGMKSFNGYIANEYYLNLPNEIDIAPVISEKIKQVETSFVQSVFNETKEQALSLVDEICKKMTKVENKEKQLNERDKKLIDREKKVNLIELEKEYNAQYSIVEQAGQKFSKEQICSFGKDFWIDLIKKLEAINRGLGRTSFCGYEYWYISDIYLALEMFWEYYVAICDMVRKDFPVSEYQISPIFEHVYCRDNLIELLQQYVDNNSECEKRDEYMKIIERLKN